MGWTRNFGKPEGILGKLILNSMNSGHTPISKWGLSHYEWKPDTAALDIGCGGGMNIRRMLALSPKGKTAGIDISDESVKKSRKVNQSELGRRCSIKKGSADAIPYKNERFDVVTAFETIYFWQDIPKALNEILRVLKPGGTFMAVCEMSDPDCIWSKAVEGIRIYTAEQLKDFFTNAGFQDIRIDRTKKVWVCVTGKKAVTERKSGRTLSNCQQSSMQKGGCSNRRTSMTIHEFGKENQEVMVMLHPLGVQWDVFEYVIPALEERFHLVIPALPGMDPDQPDSTFTSVEAIACELGKWLKNRGYENVACMYGCSMGGAIVTRMLADAQIVPKHMIIDGGITPYQLPKVITYLIAVRDWCMVELGKHASTKILRGLFPEEKYSEEDLAYVKKCLKGMSAKTIWRSFYSCNNYDMPDRVKQPTCPMQYWYGSEEKRERKWDMGYIRKTFPKTVFVELPGVGHGEYFTLHPEKFVKRVLHFVGAGE